MTLATTPTLLPLLQRIRSTILAMVAIASLAPAAVAQSPENLPPGDPGTEYVIGLLPNDPTAPSRFLGLMATAQTATVMHVDVPGPNGTVTSRSYDIFPGTITTVELPQSLVPLYSEESAALGVRVTSRAPIALYTVSSRYQSTAITPVLPITSWGTDYLAMALPNGTGERVSELMVVAAYDSTVLTVIPSARLRWHDAGREMTVLLNRGEVFMMKAEADRPLEADLSGSEIRSWSRPVGVIAGHVRAAVSADGSLQESKWSSHLATMLQPESHWRRRYTTVPTRSDREDRYRVIAAENGTTLTVRLLLSGGGREETSVRLNRGEIFDASAINGRPIRGAVIWEATAPILLQQLRLSGEYGNPIAAPGMIAPLADEDFATRTLIVAPDRIAQDPFSGDGHRVTIVVRAPSTTQPWEIAAALRIDGTPLSSLPTTPGVEMLSEAGIAIVRMQVASGGHLITSSDLLPFTAIVTGAGSEIARDAYAYTAPFWMPSPAIDSEAPFLVSSDRDPVQRDIVLARFSDNRSPSYFSGLWSVRPVNSPGWEVVGQVSPPNPDDDLTLRFRTTADPSGPLYVELRDRDGNVATVRVSDEICLRTAQLDRTEIAITSPANELPRSETTIISANICGSAARVEGYTMAGGISQYVTIAFAAGAPPFTIGPRLNDAMTMTVQPGTPQGRYTGELILRIDGSTFTLPVTIEVTAPSSVPLDDRRAGEAIALRPNPLHDRTQIELERPLDRDGSIEVMTSLGTTVRRFSAPGSHAVTFDGRDESGRPLPSGLYFVIVERNGERSAARLTITR